MKKTTTTSNINRVRFSNRSTMCVFDVPSLTKEQESNLWYSTEETDRLKARNSHRVQDVRVEAHSALLNEEGITISAAAILGLEKYLTPELTAEYKERRFALKRAVLAEHRRHRVMRVPQSTARLAMISAKHSRWARERARAAALFLEQDVLQDFKEMNLLQETLPRLRSCSMTQFNETDATEEGRKGRPYQCRRSDASCPSSIRSKI